MTAPEGRQKRESRVPGGQILSPEAKASERLEFNPPTGMTMLSAAPLYKWPPPAKRFNGVIFPHLVKLMAPACLL